MPAPSTKRTVLSIIIPVFNGWDMTSQCLHSLREHTPGDYFEVIVVDNGSSDATAAALAPLGASLFNERFIRVRCEENRNFGPGCNAGAARASGEHLFFLNNDTQLTPGWTKPLLEALRTDPKLGAVGPLLLYPGGERIQHLGVAFTPTLQVEHLFANFPADHPVAQRSRLLQAVTAAALLLPAPLFDQCGGFFPGYVNGSEDMDLCCRIRQKGLRLACAPHSRIIHLESQSAGRFDNDDHNARLLKERNLGLFAPDLHRLAAREGFRLGLSACLETFVRLAPVREAELNAMLTRQASQIGTVWETLLAEPLWAAGYDWLAQQLEQGGAMADAAAVRTLHAWFFPEERHLAKLMTTALRAGDRTMAQEAGGRIQRIQALLADRPALVRKAEHLAAWATVAGEPELEGLYREWLATHGRDE